ncbi:hypothetical protein [Streptomyces fructofermentans]|uniref:hypothetical protein n=1 Tax=Streptomyces fructofermentans TaxID=152141 RepID=UPI00167774F0|nr:hypothetical protein [Streptomyces fructofermentans]
MTIPVLLLLGGDLALGRHVEWLLPLPDEDRPLPRDEWSPPVVPPVEAPEPAGGVALGAFRTARGEWPATDSGSRRKARDRSRR